MSGPKKSSWEIARERREAKRRKQQQEIRERLNSVIKNRNKLQNEFKELANTTINNINNRINEINSLLNGDLRVAFRELKRLEEFVKSSKKVLQYENKERELKRLEEERVKELLDDLESIKSDYKEILNDGITQRVELFKNSLKVNPDNKKTLEEIKKFKEQLSKVYDDYIQQKEGVEYVADSFSKILGGKRVENGDLISVKGKINGVDISVRLNKNSKDIDFDTPMDSSCGMAMDKIVEELSKNGVNLGAIKVVKTGKILNQNSSQKSNERVRY